MINALLSGIFKLITSLANVILSPVILGITSLFPSLTIYFTSINNFLSYSITYVGLVLDLFLVPRSALVLLFDYFSITYSIYLLALSIKFIINVYNKFKI